MFVVSFHTVSWGGGLFRHTWDGASPWSSGPVRSPDESVEVYPVYEWISDDLN